MRFLLPDDRMVVGSSYSSIVAQMNDAKMTPAKNISTYRRETAKRAREMYGAEAIDDSSDKALILSLVKVGLIKRV